LDESQRSRFREKLEIGERRGSCRISNLKQTSIQSGLFYNALV